MTISTKNCVAAIVANTGAKQPWKRRSKNRVFFIIPGKGVFSEICYLREFTNDKEPEKIAFVWATEHEVVEVRVLTKEKDANQALEEDRGDRFLRDDYQVATVPIYKNEEGEEEDQDCENFIVKMVYENIIVAHFGGDWQDPIKASFRLMSDKKLYVDFSSVEKP